MKLVSFYTLWFMVMALIIQCVTGVPVPVSEKRDVVVVPNEYLVYVKTKNSQKVIRSIHNLIVKNKATYEDQEALQQLQKDYDNDCPGSYGCGLSPFVYEISSYSGTTVLFAYLSDPVAKSVKKLSLVKCISPNTIQTYSYD